MANNNPDTSGLIPWTKGQSGNPGGIPSETHAIIKRNAERAARIQEMLLEGIEAKMAAMTDPMEREAMLRADMNKIISDAMDRALGKPVQQVDQTSSDGTMTPAVIRIVPVAPASEPENG
jgi:hypothetical protein